MKDLAIFISANDQYIAKAVMALRSFQRFHPDCGYFILATKAFIRDESMEFVERYGIELMDIDEGQKFIAQGEHKNAYPVETFVRLKGPELLAKRGYKYSLMIDGDVFCVRPLEFDRILPNVTAYSGRPIGTLGLLLLYKQLELNEEFEFTYENVQEVLGIPEMMLESRYEINNGVLLWNNYSMETFGLFDKATSVFDQCRGCFESDQDLLTFTTAAYEVPLYELKSPYNFTFFDNSNVEENDQWLRKEVSRGDYKSIFVIHFLTWKPWQEFRCLTDAQLHFINLWREFVTVELGDEASNYFEDVSKLNRSGFSRYLRCRILFGYKKMRGVVLDGIFKIGPHILPFAVRHRLWKRFGRHVFEL